MKRKISSSLHRNILTLHSAPHTHTAAVPGGLRQAFMWGDGSLGGPHSQAQEQARTLNQPSTGCRCPRRKSGRNKMMLVSETIWVALFWLNFFILKSFQTCRTVIRTTQRALACLSHRFPNCSIWPHLLHFSLFLKHCSLSPPPQLRMLPYMTTIHSFESGNKHLYNATLQVIDAIQILPSV